VQPSVEVGLIRADDLHVATKEREVSPRLAHPSVLRLLRDYFTLIDQIRLIQISAVPS
jgi:hypothetical protein